MSVTGIYVSASQAGTNGSSGGSQLLYDPITFPPLYHQYYAITYDNAPTKFIEFGMTGTWNLTVVNYEHDNFTPTTSATNPYVVSIGYSVQQQYGSMDAGADHLLASAQVLADNLANGQTAYGGVIQNSNSANAALGIDLQGAATNLGDYFGIEVPGIDAPLSPSMLTPTATPEPAPGPPPDPSVGTPYQGAAYSDPNTVTGNNGTAFELAASIFGSSAVIAAGPPGGGGGALPPGRPRRQRRANGARPEKSGALGGRRCVGPRRGRLHGGGF